MSGSPHRSEFGPFGRDLLKLLALRRSQTIPQVQIVVDRGFFQSCLRRADLLELAVDRRAIRLLGSEQVIQFQPLDLKVRPFPDFGFSKIRFLLLDLLCLAGSDPNLLTDGRIA